MALIGILGRQTLSRDWLETGFLALLPKTEQKPDVAAAIAGSLDGARNRGKSKPT